MIIGLLFAWIIGGLVIGALGRAVSPGHARMGIGATLLVGLAGSFIGGVVGLAVGAGFIIRFVISVLGSAVIVSAIHSQRHFTRRQLRH